MVDPDIVLQVFLAHAKRDKQSITRALFERNLFEKMNHRDFPVDVEELLVDNASWGVDAAYRLIQEKILEKLPGAPWNPGKK